MPWRHLIFPSEGTTPQDGEHCLSGLEPPVTHDCIPPTRRIALTTLASASFNRPSRVAMESIAELSEDVAGPPGEVDTFQRRASPVTASPLAGTSFTLLPPPLHGEYDVNKSQRRASPVSTSPHLSLCEFLDALHVERGEDTGDALSTGFCSCKVASDKEGAACVCKNPEHTSSAPAARRICG